MLDRDAVEARVAHLARATCADGPVDLVRADAQMARWISTVLAEPMCRLPDRIGAHVNDAGFGLLGGLQKIDARSVAIDRQRARAAGGPHRRGGGK